MTKQWDIHEATIKKLYAENTLSVVRQIMIDEHGFRASVRAYRGRLVRWGIRKYNCRKRASSSASGSSANDGSFSNDSDAASPTVTIATADNAAMTGFPSDPGRRQGECDGYLAMPVQMDQQCPLVESGHQPLQVYKTDHSFDTKRKAYLAPPQPATYTWDASCPPSFSPPPPHPAPFSSSPAPFKKKAGAADPQAYHQNQSHHQHHHHHHQHTEALAPSPSPYFATFAAQIQNSMYDAPQDPGYGGPMSRQYDDYHYGHHSPTSGVRGGGSSSGMSYYGSPLLPLPQQQQQQQQRGRNVATASGQDPSDPSYVLPVRDYGHGG